MLVSLYTSRVVLKTLGIVDFGIYNVVGGLASSFVFFSSSLSNATQRFLNFELGRGNKDELKKVFSVSLIIYLSIAILVFIFIETIGLWFLNNKLSIPIERINAAIWVLHTFSISLCVVLVSTVFNSVLIAHENMKIYAYVGVVEAMMKLLIVYLLLLSSSIDRLVLYSILLLLVTVSIKSILAIYCVKKYSECQFNFNWSKRLFIDISRFAGWNVWGCLVYALNEQGITILLNMFFGPIVNAAKAVANQVSTTINNFSTNFFVAVKPQLIKLYSNGNLNEFIELIYNSSRYSYFLMWTISLPVIIRCEYILDFWLDIVPENTNLFIKWIVYFNLINVLINPFWTAIQAVGKMKYYMIIGSFIYLLVFPISYFFFKYGYNAVVAFQILVLIRLVYFIVTSQIVRYYINFSNISYIKEVVLPIVWVTLPTVFIMNIINDCFTQDFISLIIVSLISLLITILFVFSLGLKRKERTEVILKIKNKLHV